MGRAIAAVVLLALLGALGVRGEQQDATAYWDEGCQSIYAVAGIRDDGLAWASYDDLISATGWARLTVVVCACPQSYDLFIYSLFIYLFVVSLLACWGRAHVSGTMSARREGWVTSRAYSRTTVSTTPTTTSSTPPTLSQRTCFSLPLNRCNPPPSLQSSAALCSNSRGPLTRSCAPSVRSCRG